MDRVTDHAAPDAAPKKPRWKRIMNDLLIFAAIIGGYLLLQLVILPRLGFQT